VIVSRVIIMLIRAVAIRRLIVNCGELARIVAQGRVLKIALRDSYNVIGLN
jgi:hypothetical protein